MELRKIYLDSDQLRMVFNYGKNIKFINSYTESYDALDVIIGNDLIFENIEFKERTGRDFNMDIGHTTSRIIIRNCIFQNNLYINAPSSLNIEIYNVEFSDTLKVNSRIDTFSLKNCLKPFSFHLKGNISNQFFLQKNNFREVDISGTFSCEFLIDDIIVSETLTLAGSYVRASEITGLKCKTFNLNLANSNVKFAISRKSNIEKIRFNSNIFNGNFSISDSRIGEIEFHKAEFKKNVFIENTNFVKQLSLILKNKKLNIAFVDSHFSEIVITGKLVLENSIEFSSCSFSEIALNYLTNEGKLMFTDIEMKDPSVLYIHRSTLGKAEFYNCKFSNSYFSFEKSQITEIFISETDFPKKVFSKDVVDFGQGKLVFGQLQTVFLKQGDTVRSYEYLAREVKSYYNQLGWMNKLFFIKLGLFFNNISNNFGRNWIQGVFFTFSIGLIMFYLLLLSTDEIVLGWNVSLVDDYLHSFMKFMNPIRDFEAENVFKKQIGNKSPLTLNNSSYIVDFFGRIIIAYGYYQTIQAFRKFGKR